jgi:hypothetical protein
MKEGSEQGRGDVDLVFIKKGDNIMWDIMKHLSFFCKICKA